MPVPIWINSSDPRDFSTGAWIYTNFAKVARDWTGATSVKTDGYPICNNSDIAVTYIGWDRGEFLPTGTWMVEFAGTTGSTLKVDSQGFGVFGTYSSGVHTFVRTSGQGGFKLDFEDGEATLINLWHPDHHQSTGLLSDMAKSRIQEFAGFRTMDLQRINNSDSTGYLNFAGLNDFTFQNGVKPEVLIKIGNELNRPLGICLHHLHDDNQTSGFMGELKGGLSIPPYVEWSNEVWNTDFDQHDYAKIVWADAPTSPSTGQLGDAETAYWGNGYRSCQVMRMIKTMWPEVKTILGSQNANSNVNFGVTARGFSGALQAIADEPTLEQDVSLIFDHVAVAPYFGPTAIPDGTDSEEELYNFCTGVLEYGVRTVFDDTLNHKTTAANNSNANDITVICYEGGQHLVKSSINTELRNFNFEATGMGTLYADYLEAWEETTAEDSGIMMLYNFMGKGDANGYWGLTEGWYGEYATSPKYESVISYIGISSESSGTDLEASGSVRYLTRYSNSIFSDFRSGVQQINPPNNINYVNKDSMHQTLTTREVSGYTNDIKYTSNTGVIYTDHRINSNLPENISYIKYRKSNSVVNRDI